MSDRVVIWFWVGVLVMIAAASFWLQRVVTPPPPKNDGSTRHDPDYIVEKFSATRLGTDGKPRQLLSAAKMTHFPDDDSTHFIQPDFTRVDAARAPLRVRAARGQSTKDGKIVDFYDSVEVVRGAFGKTSEMIVKTSYLHVVPDQELASTNKPVTIHDATTDISAVGMQANNKTRVVKLLSNVKAHFKK